MKFFSLPNQLTLLRILLTPVFLFLLFSSDAILRQWSLVVFIFMAFTDWYDGWLARRWGYASRWGAFFDPLADKVVTSAALIAYAELDLTPAWPVWAIVIRDILITLLRSYAEYKEKPFDTTKLAKTKTFAQFTVIYYILILYVARSTPGIRLEYGAVIDMLLNYTLVYILMVIIATITVWTGIQYIYTNWSTIQELYESIRKTKKP
ncbi:MAG TPA: CDP-diacylglycerol--glycerol-3-phosphate 3-phosphatidyltransferase [Bacteroidota bacterium]|nr:CDP-diacylglycerol--glycerol-3-phosphate 3-phosphatidyltransferase [Bacteroidota bacterium]